MPRKPYEKPAIVESAEFDVLHHIHDEAVIAVEPGFVARHGFPYVPESLLELLWAQTTKES